MKIGIDLGSTNTCAAVVLDGRVRMIELNDSGDTILPSIVTIAEGQGYVGHDAAEKGKMFPDYDFRNFKRRLGEAWHPDEDTGYQTCEGKDEDGNPNGMTHFQGPDGFTYSPVDLTSYVIQHIVSAANTFLAPHGESVTSAVIGVPATFAPAQIAATKQAAELTGLTDVTTYEEPLAAALAYGFSAKKARRIAVVDLGGGTLDVSCVSAGGGHIDVIAKNGIGDLGGADFDRRVADYMVNLYQTEHQVDLKVRDAAMVRVLVEAEQAKKRLSNKTETTFRVENIDRTKEGRSQHMIYPLDRRTFDELTRDLRDRIAFACKLAIEDAKLKDPKFSIRDLNDVLLVGGMTRVPAIRQLVGEFFGVQPKKDESPEQVVAQGCAIKAAILEGRWTDIDVADITNFDLAVETVDNVPAVILRRGTPYPVKFTQELRNSHDDQTEISVRLLYADHLKAVRCTRLWKEDVSIDPCPAETRPIFLTVDIDRKGVPTATLSDVAP